MIRIRAFRAIDEEESCFRFIDGHQKILEVYGITKITSNNTEWVYNRGTIVVMVENEDGSKVYGGARIQMYDGVMPLPIQTAISRYDSKINQLVDKGSSEICGLWNSREVTGMGIGSIILGRVTGALIGMLPIYKTFMLCAPVTVKMCTSTGCVLVTEIGNNGLFYYPKDDLIATAMVVPDTRTMEHAEPVEREWMFKLREKPNQVIIENTARGPLEIDFHLGVPVIDVSDFYHLD